MTAHHAGGGISKIGSLLELSNCVVAQNFANVGPDIHNEVGSISSRGRNIIGDNSTVEAAFPFLPPFVGMMGSEADPRLAPLGEFGGSTRYMPPLPGSPAIEGGVLLGDTPATDQLGNLRPSGPLPDLGAVEAVPFSDLGLGSADGDTIPDILEGVDGAYPELDPLVDDSAVDTDGDGSPDGEEIANMTDPLDASDLFRVLSFSPAPGFDPVTDRWMTVEVRTFPGFRYSLEMGAGLLDLIPVPGVEYVADDFVSSFEVEVPPAKGFVRMRRE